VKKKQWAFGRLPKAAETRRGKTLFSGAAFVPGHGQARGGVEKRWEGGIEIVRKKSSGKSFMTAKYPQKLGWEMQMRKGKANHKTQARGKELVPKTAHFLGQLGGNGRYRRGGKHAKGA